MTRNQIEYWKLKESERANKANEAHARNVLTYNYAVLAETTRANKEREKELYRSNTAQEQIQRTKNDRDWILSLRSQAEYERANKAREDLQSRQLQETVRANKASELIRVANNTIQAMNAATSRMQVQEQVRNHLAQEGLQTRQISEQARANRASEQLGLLNLQETTRRNQASEANQRFANLTTRLNAQMQYNLGRDQLAETRRSHIAGETLESTKIAVTHSGNVLNSLSRLAPTLLKGGQYVH